MADFQPGRQAVVDRLKNRIGHYRQSHNLHNQHFDNSITNIYDDQHRQTLILKQRHIESKAKKTTKKTSEQKKTEASSLLATMGQSKMLARGHDQTTSSGDIGEGEPASKKQRLNNIPSHGSSGPSDIGEFQMVQQLNSIKMNNSPVAAPSNTNTQDLPVGSGLNINGPLLDDVKKEDPDNDLGNDSLLDDLPDSFGDIEEMGINIEDFMGDFPFDEIKQENSNPGGNMDLKEESNDNIFDNGPSSVSSDSGVVNGSSTSAQSPHVSATKSSGPVVSAASPAFQFSAGTPPVSHVSTPPTSYPASSSFSSTSTTTTTTSPFPNNIQQKMHRMGMGQTDISAPAAETLKHMAEQHRNQMVSTSLSMSMPRVSSGAAFSEFNFSSMSQQSPTPSGVYSNNSMMNQTNQIFNQNASAMNNMNTIEMQKKRQMFQLQQQQQQQQQQLQQSQQQQMQQVQQSQQHQGSPQGAQKSQIPQQMHQQPHTQAMGQQSVGQQQQPQVASTNMAAHYVNRMSPMGSFSTSQSGSGPQMGMNAQYGVLPPGVISRGSYPRGPSPIPSGTPQGPTTMGSAQMVCDGSNGKMTTELFYQNQMAGQYSMTQGQIARYPNQQVMASGPMLRTMNPNPGTQMAGQPAGQMMSRAPPPEYRQATMMSQQQQQQQQHQQQVMMAQPMAQMSHQIAYRGMRPGMVATPMVNMNKGQMMAGAMGQQTLPPNMPSMKPGMAAAGTMNTSPIPTQNPMGTAGAMPGGSIASGPMPTAMVSQGGMSMVANRPAMATGGIMQRSRPPNVNVGPGGLNITTQMPPSRSEWRNVLMQPQGQGIMIASGIRQGYSQQQTQGTIMTQGGQMMSIQRTPSQMMNIMSMQNGPPGGMQGAQPGMSCGVPHSGMQTNTAMMQSQLQAGNQMQQASMQHPASMQGNPRMQQAMNHMAQQQQVRMGMQMNQAGALAGQVNSHFAGQPSQVGPMGQMQAGHVMVSNPNQGRSSVPMTNITGARSPASMNQLAGHPVSPAGMNQVGGASPANMGQMGGTSPANMGQMGGTSPANMGQMSGSNQTPSPANIGGMSSHPRSPATMVQMHPRSPATMGQGGPSRPLSNPSMVVQQLSTPNSQAGGSLTPTGLSSTCMSTNPGMMSAAQGTVAPGVGVPLGGQVCSMAPSQVSSASSGTSLYKTSTNVSVNNGAPPSAGTLRPSSAGSNSVRTSQPSTPNPPTSNASSASSEFDLLFDGDGEFATLLH